MNSFRNDSEIQVEIANADCVASIVAQQLAMIPKSVCCSLPDLFLNDTFSFGYVFGFAEQASRHANDIRHDEMSRDYTEGVFGSLLKKPSAAKSFVSFASFLREDRLFEKGRQIGATDLNDWVLSKGQSTPISLRDHFNN
jgi:hypothetical protein